MSAVPQFSEDPMTALVWAWRIGHEDGYKDALKACSCERPKAPEDGVVVSLDKYRRTR